jgi:hypothetical protein
METFIAFTQKEVAAVEAAAALLETELELERLLNLRPGELAAFAASDGKSANAEYTSPAGSKT